MTYSVLETYEPFITGIALFWEMGKTGIHIYSLIVAYLVLSKIEILVD